MENSNDFLMTEKISTLLSKYSIPCIISLLVGALYNVVDQIFIANATYLGSFGNAANTVVFPLTVVALSLAVMIGDGCCAFVSMTLGEGQIERAKKSVGNAILLMIVISIILTAIFLIFIDDLITFFGATVNIETYNFAREYFYYIALGIPFYIFGQGMNPIIRADGAPNFAMFATLAGAIFNIIFDPIFIFIFKWGMMGAAVATVLGQILTAGLSLYYILNMKVIKPSLKDFKLSFNIAKLTILLGITSFLSQISLVLSMAATNNMIRRYGLLDKIFSLEQYAQIPMAVVGIVMKFYQIVVSMVIGLAAGAIPIVGFNIGAGKKERVKEILNKLLLFEFIIGLVSMICAEFFPNYLINIFGAANESFYYRDFAIKAFRIYLSMIILSCINKMSFIFLQAMGKALPSTLLSMCREIVFGIGLVILLPLFFNLDGVLLSMPVADILTFFITIFILRRTYKELKVI